MNKKVLLSLSILLLLSSLFSKDITFIKNIKLTTLYNSNILKYSADDLVDFKNLGMNEKFEIETSTSH